MSDLAVAQTALAALGECPDDAERIRATLKVLAALTRSLSRRLQGPVRRRKGEGALTFRPDKNLYQFEVELPRGPNGKHRRRVVYGKTAERLGGKLPI